MSFSSINLTLEKSKLFLFHNVPHIVRGGHAESLGAANTIKIKQNKIKK